MGGWVAGLSGNIDHLNPIEVEIEVGLGLSLAKDKIMESMKLGLDKRKCPGCKPQNSIMIMLGGKFCLSD